MSMELTNRLLRILQESSCTDSETEVCPLEVIILEASVLKRSLSYRSLS